MEKKKNMKNLIITILITLFLTGPVFATEVQWDSNPEADYYVVYWGEASGKYLQHSENITATTYEIDNPDNINYFISVKAFNSCGNSSEFSPEIQYCKTVTAVENVQTAAGTTIIINVNQ